MSWARAARSRCPCRRDVAILEATPEERLAAVDELGWAACRAWSDVLRDLDANEAGAELYREMVRRVIDDPETADGLSPAAAPDRVQATDPAHRLLRDVQPRPRAPGRPPARWHRGDHADGIQTEQGFFELDVIVFATGFDAMTGALFRIDIRGRDGLPLRDAWADGARTLLGVQTAGFPNFFTITGPGSPSVLANMVVCAEQHIEFIGELLTYVRDHGHTVVGAHAGGAGRLGRRGEPGRHRHDVHRAHVQLLVPGRQHPGQGRASSCPGSAGCPATSTTATASWPRATRGSSSHERSARDRSTAGVRLRPVRRGRRTPTPTRRGSSRASTARWRGASGTVASGSISGYDQVAAAFRDWEHFSSARTDPEISSIVLGQSRLPLLTPEEIDPPDWYPVRRVLSELLAPGARSGCVHARSTGRRTSSTSSSRRGECEFTHELDGAGARRGHARVARVPRSDWRMITDAFHNVAAYSRGTPEYGAAQAEFGNVMVRIREEVAVARALTARRRDERDHAPRDRRRAAPTRDRGVDRVHDRRWRRRHHHRADRCSPAAPVAGARRQAATARRARPARRPATEEFLRFYPPARRTLVP